IHGAAHGKGSVSVIDFATRKVDVTWPIPGGGSPDMGNVSADGKTLRLYGRYDNVVYAIDTATGAVRTIPVGREPHGLTVWPQPGRYSLGHTGTCASPRPDGLIEQHADLGETAAGQHACRNYAIDAPQPYHLHGTRALWLNLP